MGDLGSRGSDKVIIVASENSKRTDSGQYAHCYWFSFLRKREERIMPRKKSVALNFSWTAFLPNYLGANRGGT